MAKRKSNKSYRCYNVGNSMMEFNFDVFEEAFASYCKSNGCLIGNLEVNIGQQIGASKDAVHNWRMKTNGPDDIETVKKLSKILGVKDFKKLLKPCEAPKKAMPLTENQIESVKKISDLVIEFLEEFHFTTGFNDLWDQFNQPHIDDPRKALEKHIDQKHFRMHIAITQEYFYLGNHPIYDELYNFIWDILPKIYSGKLSYAYRLEADTDGKDTVYDDYDWAFSEFYDILGKYLEGTGYN